jgi:transposase-like protein
MVRQKNPEFEYLPDGRGRLKAHVQITCSRCGNEALVRVDGSQRFCSKSCSTFAQHADGRSRQASGEEHYAWKGQDAQYQARHMRVIRSRGRADRCEWRSSAHCASVKYEWSHIHGTDPGNVANYRPLCKECHQRYDKQTGSDHANAKLTAPQAADIRARYAVGGISQQSLADEYGVSQALISKLILGRTYR